MKNSGDTTRPRSVKADFDNDFDATALGGAVLAEKTLRGLRLRRMIDQHLPRRSRKAGFSSQEAVYSLIAGLLVGGRGEQAAEDLRRVRCREPRLCCARMFARSASLV